MQGQDSRPLMLSEKSASFVSLTGHSFVVQKIEVGPAGFVVSIRYVFEDNVIRETPLLKHHLELVTSKFSLRVSKFFTFFITLMS